MGDYAVDRNGQVRRDRYGRPIQARSAADEVRPRPEPIPTPRPRSARGYGSRGIPARDMPKRRRVVAPLLSLILLVLIVGTVGLGVWADSQLTRIDAIPPHSANSSGTNWLLVGSDSRAGLSQDEKDTLVTGDDEGSSRTDTIMLLHIVLGQQPTLVSIPRDSYVNIPGYGQDKINAAFALGGSQLLITTVEQATGLRIHHYAEIGFGGLAGVVDAVGGVTVCPQEGIVDDVIGFYITAGCQRLDGPAALSYSRTRQSALGDIDRVARQREVLAALQEKITSPATMFNPLRAIPLVHQVGAAFTVDESDHVWHLVRVALAMRGGVNEATVPVGSFADTEVGSVILWDTQGAANLFNSIS
ncbi:MAG: LCP family protein [Corynebacterium sp.]|nr:LCP family protein [Corynebacterium sp.]